MKYLRLSAIAILPVAFFGLIIRPVAAQTISPEDVTAQVATFIGNNLLTSAVASTDVLSWTVKSVFEKKVEFEKKIEVDGEATFHDKAFFDFLAKIKTLKVTGNANIGNDSDDVITIESKIKRDDGKVYVKDGLRVTGDFDLDTASIDSDEIKNETLLSKDILDGKIQGKDIKDATLTADKIASEFTKGSDQIILVSPESTATASGTALKSAVEGISDASAANPYVVLVEPGIFDLDTGSIVVPDYVSIIGSGEGVTTITSDSDGTGVGTVFTGSHVTLRHMTIENITETATAITVVYNGSTDVVLEYVTLFGDGTNSTLANNGLLNNTGASAILRHVTINLADPTNYGKGIYNLATVDCYSCMITIETDGANIGIEQYQGTTRVFDSVITADDGGIRSGSDSYGILATGGTLEVYNSLVTGVDAEDDNYGLLSQTAGTAITIERSTFVGDDLAIYLDHADTVIDIAYSQLNGGLTDNASATETCVGAYNGSFAALNTSCQ